MTDLSDLVGGGVTGYNWVAKTTTYTAINNDGILADSSGGAFTVTLPATPVAGNKVMFSDGKASGSWGTNVVTVGRNGATIEGASADFSLNVSDGWAEFVYDGTTWQVRTQFVSSGGVDVDGWVSVSDTWTYATATTITVPSGAASKYSVGDKVKLTQTTPKYFYIISVADTVLTVTGGSDYTVANAAITSPNYSKVASPLGFPQWFACGAFTYNVATIDDGAGGQPTTTATTFHCQQSRNYKNISWNSPKSGGRNNSIRNGIAIYSPRNYRP